MGWEIVKQPSGRYARFTTVTMSNTHVNKSGDEMVALLIRDYGCSALEAERMVARAMQALPDRKCYESGRL